ncbi:hypothetical protein [Achromobacter mucicolens]|uniref:hypothetical protein n=1 Tax=Achromobacter mucicolens TaxID=1389922 RepID=UPI002FE3783B
MKTIPLAFAAAAAALLPTLASAAYTPTEIERAILEYGIREEHDALLAADWRLLGRVMDYSRVDAQKISDIYAKGPNDKVPAVIDDSFVIKTTIGAAAAKAGVVTFAGTRGATVRAMLPAGAKPADALLLNCTKLAWADGVATFSQCQDWAPIAEKTVATFRADIAAFLQGKPVKKYVAKFVVDYFVVAGDMPDKSGCPDDRKACDQAIRKTDMKSAGYQAVNERLQAAGVQTGR